MGSWRGGEPAGGIPTGGEKRSWKGKGKAHAPTAAAGKFWVSGAGRKPLVSGNLVRLFLALVTLLATTAGMVVYLLNTNLSTPVVSLVAIDYEHPWAPNAWAVEDQQRLQRLQESTAFQVSSKRHKAGEETWQELIQAELDKTTPGMAGSIVPAFWGYRTLMVHLSAHGVLNGLGVPCVLFSDADPLNDQTWVPVTDVLRFIGEHSMIVASDVRVLVVLDTGKQPPDVRCGLLSTGFIEAAREKIQALPFRNFAVLLSHAEDQYAWPAPELGGSVFGVMLASGLQGQADVLSGDQNSWVSVQELAEFVSATVDGYVREYRGRVQTPQLVWCGENQANDFDLSYLSSNSSSSADSYQPDKTRIDTLSKAWESFQLWSERAPSHLAWERASAAGRLARAEQLLWAGAGYNDQFHLELETANKIIHSMLSSRWPSSICGTSLAFLHRVHRLDPEQELKLAGLDPAWAVVPAPSTNSSAPPSSAPPSSVPPSSVPAASVPAASVQPVPAGEAPARKAEEAEQQPDPNSQTPKPAQLIAQWLTNATAAEPGASGQPGATGQEPSPPAPERPELPDRLLAITFLTKWLSANPQWVRWSVLERAVDWLGPIPDSRSLTRDEALLRTIGDHLRLTHNWNLPIQDRIGPLWSQYLQVAAACEVALAPLDSRTSRTLQRESDQLASDLQLIRDHIHGCETERDVSDCADELIALRTAAEKILDIRQRLERGWRLRDELAAELPTLAHWISSPICRVQSLISATAAWELTGQLNQQLHALQIQLSAGKVPSLDELQAAEQGLNRLTTAYSKALYDIIELNAKGQPKPLGDLMLCLGLRPNVMRGPELGKRSELHLGLDRHCRDLENTFSDQKLKKYCTDGSLDGVDNEPIWRLSDLPSNLSDLYTPVLFTQTMAARPIAAAQSTAPSPRLKWAIVGGELRNAWSSLPKRLADDSQSSVEAMSSQDLSAIAQAEEKLRNADYHAHLLAQLVPCDRLNVLPAPIPLNHSVCNQQHAMWQGQRALGDFWHTPRVQLADQSSFMLASAVDWQKSTPFPASGPAKLFEQHIVGAGRMAQLWPTVFQDASAGPADGDEWQAAMDLTQFPTGRAWLSLALSGNSTQMHKLDNQRFQAEFGTGQRASSAARFTLTTEPLPEGSHEAIAWFRGHSATRPVTIYQRQPPIILAWEPEELGATTIRVSAETKPARIVFVLDCSGSLGTESMQAAKNTLIDVIRELSKLNAGQTEIAVILFGHTSEYSKISSTAPDLHSAWPGRKNRPYNDIELVQELAFPSPQVIDSLQKKLANLQSFGRTPLYESLLQAITLLTNRNGGFKGDLRVVAITDGADNVLPFSDPADNARAKNNYLVPKEYIHTEQDPVRRAAGQVSLDFVPVDQKEGLEQLKRMAAATGGSVYQANIGNLAEQLRNSIARDTYSTQNLKTKQWVGSRRRLTAEQIIPAPQIPGLFEVTVDNTSLRKSVQVLGGETIELQYQRQVGLTFLPYDEGDKNPQRGEFTLAGQPFQAIMLTANPVSVPQVRICLQSTNPSVQSIRPKQFVLELRSTQSGQDGQGTRLAWTSDGMWENHHNSPVLRVVIKNAPRFYPDRLECRLWLGPQTDRPSAEVWPVARLKEQAVEVVPGVSASAQTEREAGGLRLTVTEKRNPEAPLVHWQIQPSPDKFVEHQVHATQVVHEYFFTDASVLSKLQVVATPLPLVPRQDWQATPWIPVPEWK